MVASVHANHSAGAASNGRSDNPNSSAISSEQLFKARVAAILKSLGAKGADHKRLAGRLELSDRALDYLADEDRAPARATCARLATLLIGEGRVDDAFVVLSVNLRPTIEAMADQMYRGKLRELLDEKPKLRVVT